MSRPVGRTVVEGCLNKLFYQAMRLDRDGLESKTSLKEVRNAGVETVDWGVLYKDTSY